MVSILLRGPDWIPPALLGGQGRGEGGGGSWEDDVMCAQLVGGRGPTSGPEGSVLTLQFPADGWTSLRSRPHGKESGSFKLGEGGWAEDPEASLRSPYQTARGVASLCKSELLIADAPSPHAPLAAPIGYAAPGPIDNKQGCARPGGGATDGGGGNPAPPLLRGADMAEGGTGR